MRFACYLPAHLPQPRQPAAAPAACASLRLPPASAASAANAQPNAPFFPGGVPACHNGFPVNQNQRQPRGSRLCQKFRSRKLLCPQSGQQCLQFLFFRTPGRFFHINPDARLFHRPLLSFQYTRIFARLPFLFCIFLRTLSRSKYSLQPFFPLL